MGQLECIFQSEIVEPLLVRFQSRQIQVRAKIHLIISMVSIFIFVEFWGPKEKPKKHMLGTAFGLYEKSGAR